MIPRSVSQIQQDNNRVLIVEDDAFTANEMRLLLHRQNYLVELADTADKAMSFCDIQTPDLVLVDRYLGKGDGIELAKWLAKREIPFAFVTADLSQSTIDEALELGAAGYFPKPVQPDSLHICVRAAFTVVQQRKALSTINIAIGLLMQRFTLTSKEAEQKLRKLARSRQMKVMDCALQMTQAADQYAVVFADGATSEPGAASPGSKSRKPN